MATKKIKSVPQVAPTKTHLLKSELPTFTNCSVRTYRPAKKISTLIKRGLIEGVKADSELNDALYDDKEGSCPPALRMDVDKFDLATTMLRNGDSQKSVTQALLNISAETEN